jgi:hypothetical protein
LFVFFFLVLVPVVRILRRTGHNPVWCLLTLVPGLTFLLFGSSRSSHGPQTRIHERGKLKQPFLIAAHLLPILRSPSRPTKRQAKSV